MTDVNTNAAPAVTPETIDDVREMLFGADKRASDEKIQHMDARLDRLDEKLAKLDASLAKLDAKHAQLDQRHAQLDARQAELDARQAELNARQAELDARFSRVAQVDGRFAQVDNQFAQFEKWMDQLDTRVGQGLSAVLQEKRATDVRFKKLEDLLDDARAEIVADKGYAEARFAAVGAEARAAEGRVEALAKEFERMDRLSAEVEKLKRGQGIGAAIGYSLRNFSTVSRSR
ncbi:DNA repair exonuclease SbcCD ATPase subunit [Rhodoblastus acidophilus]|uniref:hypothetical protein n=1 Tax=Rhodoblastus acidophilus TaxID=1074 RepID=UPI002224F83E|nr:hypothetical protein [Rhodoblastus acidophilus]MCW2282969.1 DNA repair exonuclease SbcCD ATPase subunit [Rhodoblastus acidophilus]MCW2331980.1 DNA repair exonuclease SbcCD ATPase subunit [Rhodoblastus acidophilus]